MTTGQYNYSAYLREVKGLETKLIASQLQVKALREALTHVSLCGRNSMSSLAECGKIANCALSQPTDTAEADALLARVKELESIQTRRETKWARLAFNAELQEELAAARAVIEEAEEALQTMKMQMQDHGMFESQYKVADKPLTRIREWKEGK